MMSTSATRPSLPDTLDLLSDAHRAAVLAHPAWTHIAQACSPAAQLAWMVRQRLLSYDELDDLYALDAEASEHDRIIEQAFEELGRQDAPADAPLTAATYSAIPP